MRSSEQKKRYGYKYVRSWYIRGIVMDNVNGKPAGRGPYHNIRHVDWAINRFTRKMLSLFPNATHVNFYDYKGKFLFQYRYEVVQFEEKELIKVKIKKKKAELLYYNAMSLVTGQVYQYNLAVFGQWDL